MVKPLDLWDGPAFHIPEVKKTHKWETKRLALYGWLSDSFVLIVAMLP